MHPLVVPFPSHEPLASRVALRLGAELGPLADTSGEIAPSRRLAHREVILVRALERPDQLLPLLSLARQVRRRAANLALLVAPRIVQPPSEGMAGGSLRTTLLRHFDGVITVAGDGQATSGSHWVVAPAGPALAEALQARLRNPFFVPAADVSPWMEELAAGWGAPLLSPARLFTTAGGGCSIFWERNPVLLADAVGDGQALAAVARALRHRGAPPPQAAVVHADFLPGALSRLEAAGIAGVTSTNTLLHPTNRADVSESIVYALWQLWSGSGASLPAELPTTASAS